MIKGRQLAQQSSFAKESLTAWSLRGADFIKVAKELMTLSAVFEASWAKAFLS
jgi:hypothetical protein